MAKLQARLEHAVPGFRGAFSQPVELRMAELTSGSRSDLAITVQGEDFAVLAIFRLEHEG